MRSKRVIHSEVNWMLRANNINADDQANHKLEEKIGKELMSHFARICPGAGYYEWLFDCPGEPHPLSEAPADVVPAVRTAFQELTSQVQKKFGNSILGQRLTHVPNDDYIFYYKDADGNYQVILTGWGFTNFRGSTGSTITKKLADKPVTVDVNIGFSNDGELLKNYPFSLLMADRRMPNNCTTDSGGLYHFATPIRVGTTFSITELIGNKQFELRVQEGQTEYIFDLTESVNVSVIVSQDGRPLPGAEVTLNYRDQQQTYMTDGSGMVVCSLNYHDNETVSASCNGKKATQAISHEGNELRIDLKTVTESPVVKVIDQNGNPISGYQLRAMSNMGQLDLITDANGKAVLPEMKIGEQFGISDATGKSEGYQVEENHGDYLFPIFVEPPVVETPPPPQPPLPPPPPPQERFVRIHILDRHGNALDNITVFVDTPTGTLSSVSDADGYAVFPASAFVNGQKAKVRFTVSKEYKKMKKEQRKQSKH